MVHYHVFYYSEFREGSLYIACNDRNAFFTYDAVRNYNLWSWQKVCEALTFLLDNIYFRFGFKLYSQTVGIPISTNCAPLVAILGVPVRLSACLSVTLLAAEKLKNRLC